MDLLSLIRNKDVAFWPLWSQQMKKAKDFVEMASLTALRKKALKVIPAPSASLGTLRVAMVGGCTLYPLHDLVESLLLASGYEVSLFVGEFDNYLSEIIEPTSPLYDFKPNIVVVIPSEKRCRYQGKWTDSVELQKEQAQHLVNNLLDLCKTVHSRTGAEVILSNFVPSGRFDPGAFRNKSLGTD